MNIYLEKIAGLLGKHNSVPDSAFPKHELQMGRKVEHEHTSDYQTAENIAKDHLSEYKHYYSDLEKMEAREKMKKALEKQADEYADMAKIKDQSYFNDPERRENFITKGHNRHLVNPAVGAVTEGGVTGLAGLAAGYGVLSSKKIARGGALALGGAAALLGGAHGERRAAASHKKERLEYETAVLRQLAREHKRQD